MWSYVEYRSSQELMNLLSLEDTLDVLAKANAFNGMDMF